LTGTLTSTSWSTTSRLTPCLRAAGGDWSKDFDYDYMVDYRPRGLRAAGGDWSKDFYFDYMVDYHPRNILPEGRGW
jgi:hypothetical protein